MMPRSGPVKERPSVGLQAVSARPGRPAWQLPQRAFVTTRIAWDVPCRTARSGLNCREIRSFREARVGGGSVTLCLTAFQSNSRTGGADSAHDPAAIPATKQLSLRTGLPLRRSAACRESFAHLTGIHTAGNDCIREKSSRLTALRPGWSDQLVVRGTFQEAAAAHNDHTRLVHHLPVLRRVGLSDLVGCQQEQGHRRRLLPGRPQSGLVDHRRLDFRLQHRLRAHRRPGRFRREGRRGARALRAARLVSAGPGVGLRAVLHALARLHDAGVPRAALLGGESATSCRSSRIITFIVSKIAVGIFAGGVVFGTLLPDLHITIGSVTIDSFWIGSVLVIAADRPLHGARRHARGRLQRRRPGVRAHHRVVRC